MVKLRKNNKIKEIVMIKKINRVAQYPIEDLILNRWSPRAFSGELLTNRELMSLFEAARWAPSSYNNQPWRFIYAQRGTPAWDIFFNLMVEFNKSWTHNAAVLVVIVSHNIFEFNGKPSRTHSFDTGSAWQNLALQGTAMGLVVHGMEGFDYDRAKAELNIPDDYTVEAMCAIGKPGSIDELPEALRAKEVPSGRKELSKLIFEGSFSE